MTSGNPSLRIRKGVVAIFATASIVCLTLGAIVMRSFATDVGANYRQLSRDRDIWRSGIPAANVAVTGTVDTFKAIFHTYNLHASFTTAAGEHISGRARIESVWITDEAVTAPEVRYDAGSPHNFVISSAIALTKGRILDILFDLLLGCGLVAGGILAISAGCALHLRAIVLCSSRYDFVDLTTTKVTISLTTHGSHSRNIYHYEVLDARGRRRSGSVDFRKNRGPLLVSKEPPVMRALRSPLAPRHLVVLRNDYWPYWPPTGAHEPIPVVPDDQLSFGVDWQCGTCGDLNPGDATRCRRCREYPPHVKAQWTQFREWQHVPSSASTHARLVMIDGSHVVLERKDGRTARIPIVELSKVDRRYLDTCTELAEQESRA